MQARTYSPGYSHRGTVIFVCVCLEKSDSLLRTHLTRQASFVTNALLYNYSGEQAGTFPLRLCFFNTDSSNSIWTAIHLVAFNKPQIAVGVNEVLGSLINSCLEGSLSEVVCHVTVLEPSEVRLRLRNFTSGRKASFRS